jgi:hypothetical protein
LDWWQTLLVALGTYAGTKLVDHLLAISREKRDFRKHRRERAFSELEELKDEIGRLYELSANWKAYDIKAEEYVKALAHDDYLVGKYNKYPNVAAAARDTIHLCKIVAFDERERDRHGELISNKKELTVQYQAFIQVCDKYIESLA